MIVKYSKFTIVTGFTQNLPGTNDRWRRYPEREVSQTLHSKTSGTDIKFSEKLEYPPSSIRTVEIIKYARDKLQTGGMEVQDDTNGEVL